MIILENAVSIMIFGLIIVMLIALFITAQASLYSTSSETSKKIDLERARSEESISVRWLGHNEILLINRGSRDLIAMYLYVYSEGSRVPTNYTLLNLSLEVGESRIIDLASLGMDDSNITRIDIVTDLGLVFSSFKPNRLMEGVKVGK